MDKVGRLIDIWVRVAGKQMDGPWWMGKMHECMSKWMIGGHMGWMHGWMDEYVSGWVGGRWMLKTWYRI